jgi:hypothetical protein
LNFFTFYINNLNVPAGKPDPARNISELNVPAGKPDPARNISELNVPAGKPGSTGLHHI